MRGSEDEGEGSRGLLSSQPGWEHFVIITIIYPLKILGGREKREGGREGGRGTASSAYGADLSVEERERGGGVKKIGKGEREREGG